MVGICEDKFRNEFFIAILTESGKCILRTQEEDLGNQVVGLGKACLEERQESQVDGNQVEGRACLVGMAYHQGVRPFQVGACPLHKTAVSI